MTKAELIAKIAAGNDKVTKKETEAIVNAVFEEIKTAMKAEKVSIAGFGTFETRERAARTGRNPRTGADIKIAAAKVPAFKAGKALKDAIAD